MTVDEALEQAIAFHTAGQLQQAESLYRQILAHDPNHARATHLLGLLAFNLGRNDVADQLIGRAISLDSSRPEFFGNHGLVLVELARTQDAIACYRRALQMQPNFPEALNNLGLALYHQEQFEESIACYQRALALRPDFAQAMNNLGNSLDEVDRAEEAVAWYHKAISLHPEHADAYNNLADIYVEQGKLDEALVLFEKACERRQNYAEAYSNIANVMYRKCRLSEAIAFGRRAIAIKPDFPTARWNLGLSLLCTGQFIEGWQHYAWRTRVRDMAGSCREFPQPQWDGSELNGRTLLVHAEQGFGDTLQFIRYLPMVQAKASSRGGRLLLDGGKELSRLLQANYQVDQWICHGDPMPRFDLHCPMLSLPMVMGTTLQTIPAQVPYLSADPQQIQIWKQRLSAQPGQKVGLVWAGRPSTATMLIAR